MDAPLWRPSPERRASRTRSGKIVELAVRDVGHGRPVCSREALDTFAAWTQLDRS